MRSPSNHTILLGLTLSALLVCFGAVAATAAGSHEHHRDRAAIGDPGPWWYHRPRPTKTAKPSHTAPPTSSTPSSTSAPPSTTSPPTSSAPPSTTSPPTSSAPPSSTSPPTSSAPPTSSVPPTTSAPPTTTTTSAPPACANPKDPWASLAACGWPGPTNTGYDLGACPGGLTVDAGSTTRVIAIRTDNQVISCARITGSLDIQAKNVTIQNSYVSYDGGGGSGTGVIKVEDGASARIQNVEINGLNHTHSCVWHQGTSMTAAGINCYGVNDGIFSWADVGYSSTTGDNFSITDSYFHDLTTNAANGHIDGYQTEGAAHGLISHNTYAMPASANSAIAIWDSLKSSTDITVSNNLITGGGFSVYAEDYSPSESSPTGGYTVTGVSFVDNTFSTHAGACVGAFGVWFTRPTWTYQGGPTDGWHRSGNTVLETGEAVDSTNPHAGGQLCS